MCSLTHAFPAPCRHVANVGFYHYKQSLARPSTSMPGAWYPDERFIRIHLVKSAMPTPLTFEEAMQNALHVLNVISVPGGNQIGTDTVPGGDLSDTHTMPMSTHMPTGPCIGGTSQICSCNGCASPTWICAAMRASSPSPCGATRCHGFTTQQRLLHNVFLKDTFPCFFAVF